MSAVYDFTPLPTREDAATIVRPALSYWQDAWRRLRANRAAMAALWTIGALLLFATVGPWVWRVDPAAQDVDRISEAPSFVSTARVAAEYSAWPLDARDAGTTAIVATILPEHSDAPALGASAPSSNALPAPRAVTLDGPASTREVRLRWDAVVGATAYRVYRTRFAPENHLQLGMPIGEVYASQPRRFEDRMNLEPVRYYYSVVALDAAERESSRYRLLDVQPERVITLREARERGVLAVGETVQDGEQIQLAAHPLGTDYLGRDMLARLMHGARVSLFIGIVAPLAYVLLGVLYGALAGYLGGAVDSWLMRFADFMVALPFLLLMILMRIAFGIEGGESGIVPLLIALIVLSWPSTARLVRGQVLQIREEGYVQAARLLGAPTYWLVLRHMLPNTLGVVLVTLTFAVPSAIFTEAFLSFIGMGVAPPTPSWGSMCNEGRKTMLVTPHELIAPAVLISLTVLAFNTLGDGLRDALDARMRNRE